MSFSSKPFWARFSEMGDLSEQKFKEWADRRNIIYVEYGLNRPPFRSFQTLPLVIRSTPDFLCEGTRKFFVECKGTGGRTVKIKATSMAGMAEWRNILPLWLFIYNSKKDQYAFTKFRELERLCQLSPTKHFENDGNEYYDVPVKMFDWYDTREDKIIMPKYKRTFVGDALVETLITDEEKAPVEEKIEVVVEPEVNDKEAVITPEALDPEEELIG